MKVNAIICLLFAGAVTAHILPNRVVGRDEPSPPTGYPSPSGLPPSGLPLPSGLPKDIDACGHHRNHTGAHGHPKGYPKGTGMETHLHPSVVPRDTDCGYAKPTGHHHPKPTGKPTGKPE